MRLRFERCLISRLAEADKASLSLFRDGSQGLACCALISMSLGIGCLCQCRWYYSVAMARDVMVRMAAMAHMAAVARLAARGTAWCDCMP